jgi:hypothetical protein
LTCATPAYYADGLVLLTTSLQAASKKEECTPRGAPNLDAADFQVRANRTAATPPASSAMAVWVCVLELSSNAPMQAILITTLAEAPGLLATALLIDSKGRKWTLRAGLAVCAVSLGALLLDPPRAQQLALLFVARGCIEGEQSHIWQSCVVCRCWQL